MKKLIVTRESLERAKDEYQAAVGGGPGWVENAFNNALDALFVPEDEARQQPKPFGPGTRLRAANGDELRVIEYYGFLGIANMSTNQFGMPTGPDGWHKPDNLQELLARAGATVIEGEK